MQDPSTAIVVSIACPNKLMAMNIGRTLVTEKLVACAQLFPIHSIFQWDGAIQSEEEVVLQAKTFSGQLPKIEGLVVKMHEYEVPEIIATPIAWAHQPYLDWMEEVVA